VLWKRFFKGVVVVVVAVDGDDKGGNELECSSLEAGFLKLHCEKKIRLLCLRNNEVEDTRGNGNQHKRKRKTYLLLLVIVAEVGGVGGILAEGVGGILEEAREHGTSNPLRSSLYLFSL